MRARPAIPGNAFPVQPEITVSRYRLRSPILAASFVAAAGFLILAAQVLEAGPARQPGVSDPAVQVPGFWDPRRRPERPDLSRVNVIRFITEIDYPPFNFAGPDGNPQGFNVDLARLICEELKVACTHPDAPISRRMVATLNANQADAAIASIAVTSDMRVEGRFHRSVLPHAGPFRGAARFRHRRTAAREARRPRRSRWSPAPRTRPISRPCSPRPSCVPYPNADGGARRAARAATVDLLFGDAISLAFWLNGTDSENCCALSRRALRRQPLFRRGHRASRSGAATTRCARRSTGRCSGCGSRASFTDLWLRYFPDQPVLNLARCG